MPQAICQQQYATSNMPQVICHSVTVVKRDSFYHIASSFRVRTKISTIHHHYKSLYILYHATTPDFLLQEDVILHEVMQTAC